MPYVILLACAVAGAAIRNRKGEPVQGFVAGLVLGPLGVVLAALYPVRGRSLGVDQKKCPDCAEWVKGEANVCRFCGRHFEAATPA